MSIVQDEKELEYWSDKKLLDEAKSPTGQMPLFLVHTQIEKRKNYRDRANARKQTPTSTVFEEDVSEFGGGLASLPQQMNMPPPPNQGMPPQGMPPQGMPPPQPQMMSDGGKIYNAKYGMGLMGMMKEQFDDGGSGSFMGILPSLYESHKKKKEEEEEKKKTVAMQTGGRMPMASEAEDVAAQGRFGDSMLVHMNPVEVAAMNQNGDLTVNPQTGLPEAWAFTPILPWLAQMGRAGLGYLGRGGFGLRSRLPTWLGGIKPITDPRRLLPYRQGTALQSRQQLVPYQAPSLLKRGLGGLWGSMKKHPFLWGFGGLGAFQGMRGLGDEDELPVTYGGYQGDKPLSTGPISAPSPDITSLSEELYGTFMQPEADYLKELEAAEGYRRTPEQRKAEAQGIAFSGLAKALSNVGMENIISGVADVTPEVIALRKYQTEEQRVVDKNVADLKRMRRGDKASAMQAAMQWEEVKNKKASYERAGELAIYDAALKAWQSQLNYGMPGSIPFEIYAHYYRTGEWLGSGSGSAQEDLDEAGLTE